MFPRTLFSLCFALALAIGFGGSSARAQDVNEMRVELAEARTALQASLRQRLAIEKELARLKTVNGNLSESLQIANTEAEEFKNSYEQMRLQMEALGIEAVTGGSKSVEGKLVKAVSDLRLLGEEKGELAEALIKLADASMRFSDIAQDADPEARDALRKAVAESDRVLGLGGARNDAAPLAATSLHNGRIVSLKKDHGVVIMNVGRQVGVRYGMPFNIYRKDRPVGSVVIVDIRDNIAAALIKNLNNDADPPRVGDLVKPATD